MQDFGRRLERDVKKFVNDRLDATKALTGQEVGRDGKKGKVLIFFFQPKPIEVQVIQHQMQRYAVWFGGSMLASTVGNVEIQRQLRDLS